MLHSMTTSEPEGELIARSVKQLATVLANSGRNMGSFISGREPPCDLHRANACCLQAAFLSIDASRISTCLKETAMTCHTRRGHSCSDRCSSIGGSTIWARALDCSGCLLQARGCGEQITCPQVHWCLRHGQEACLQATPACRQDQSPLDGRAAAFANISHL